ncbi:MAG TPA: hypothetical protein VGI92_10170 [Gemmatimonadales bacterium]|jgi:putative aminopeptidase FrvX
MRSFRRSALALVVGCALPLAAHAQSLDSLVMRIGAMSAVTGMEDAMADTLIALLPGAARDRGGNVVWTRGSGAPVRIAACGMDEIGYVVGSVNDEGYLTLRRVGNAAVGPLYDQFLEGQRVTVFGRHGPVPGVVGVRSTHLTRGRGADGDPAFALDNAYVDVGAANAADIARLGIEVLAPVTRAKQVQRYGPNRALVAAPWIAQRAACAALLSAARRASSATGTTIVVFGARTWFTRDGMQLVTGAHPDAAVMLVGMRPAPNANLRSAELPVKYQFTPAETVSLADVHTLEATLQSWLEGR